MLEVNGNKIKAVIIDMDGVLWKENEPIADLPRLFENFDTHSIKVTLATNNASRSTKQILEKLKTFRVKLKDSQIVTSAMATAFMVHKDFPKGGPVYMSGFDALKAQLEMYNFFHSEKNPQAVIAGIDPNLSYKSIKDTSLLIQTGVPFYFTNPDPTYPTPEGNCPGAGTILAALETASGVKAKVAGKPLPFLFELALNRMDTKPEDTLVIGDRLNTDILGGYNAGCKTLFVLSGVNTMEDLNSWEPRPDAILNNISELFQ